MGRLIYIFILAQALGCSSSSGGESSPDSPSEPPILSPTGFSVSPNKDGSVTVDWNSSLGIAYDLYSSTDAALDPDNYSVYDHAEFKKDVLPPHQFIPAEPAETYTFKLIARSGSNQSDPAEATAYTRFSISEENPSIYFDALEKLEVKRCSEGQQYDYLSEQCQNNAVRYTPNELSTHLDNVSDGWRLPTTEELDSLSPCNLSGTQAACVPRSKASVIMDFFIGSTIAAYYDLTALEPYLDRGSYWHMAHGFPDDYRGVMVNYGSSPSMHAVLVRTAEQ